MKSTDGKNPDDVPWFRRFRPDGRVEPHVARGDNGEIVILDDGWAASFKDGKWHEALLFQHEQIAEFTPVQTRAEIYRLLDEARSALAAKGSR